MAAKSKGKHDDPLKSQSTKKNPQAGEEGIHTILGAEEKLAQEGGKPKDLSKLKKLVYPHVESFNYFLNSGIHEAVADLDPVELSHEGKTLHIWISSIRIDKPSHKTLTSRLYPHECRESGLTYGGQLNLIISTQIEDLSGMGPIRNYDKNAGRIPIMLTSDACHLNSLTPQQMVSHKEEANELGGYFIVNGLEKLFRLIVIQKRNYPLCLSRATYSRNGPNFSEHVVNIRSVRPDQTSESFTIHYLNNGDCSIRMKIMKKSYFLPFVTTLKALIECTDREIYERLVNGEYDNTFLTERVESLLRHQQLPNKSHLACLAHLGSIFRIILKPPERFTDVDVGRLLLRKFIAVHLGEDNRAKFDLLILMVRKLYYQASGASVSESSDSLSTQEVLLPGHVFNMILKEKLSELLENIKMLLQKGTPKSRSIKDLNDEEYFKLCLSKTFDVGAKLNYFVSTGNLQSPSGLDLRQASGYSVAAERVNYFRFLAHFRGVHRGQFFAELRTTTVRKLLPDSWGFFCPVHTPDGSPCGLLNHMTCKCSVSDSFSQAIPEALQKHLFPVGLNKMENALVPNLVPVLLDGRVLGNITKHQIDAVEGRLRQLKVNSTPDIPSHMEVVVMRPEGNQFPAIYIFTGPARFIRPVINLKSQKTELIGPFEQVYLNVAVRKNEVKNVTTHLEKTPMNMLSLVAGLIPFCNSNQSPRNMYQCQMVKQTMGTPIHAYPYRNDTKIFRLQTPQTPIVRNEWHDKFHLDDYLTGTNAVVAVLAYTGYDMEDAMIINKSAWERGFGHGCVYKASMVDLRETFEREPNRAWFCNVVDGKIFEERLDRDGLPSVGQPLKDGDPYYSYWDDLLKKIVVKKFKGKEDAYVDGVTPIGFGDTFLKHTNYFQKVYIRIRHNRQPTRGDKFSSRHGQKGTLAQLWPQINMPFTESGMTPDIIINPNAFPSRMTVAMLIESMAAKSGALQGTFVDSTPFRYDEENTAVNEFGKQLLAAGYNYYGNEPMYSGVTGEEFEADIFFGVVYYQRLRHMVKDKFQVRTQGVRNPLTRQPVKGRKRGGGIRFGEMERDALLSHGAAFLIHDRLLNCSDIHTAYICNSCGSILTPTLPNPSATSAICYFCDPPPIDAQSKKRRDIPEGVRGDKRLRPVVMPYVTRFLVNELAAMNIRCSFEVK